MMRILRACANILLPLLLVPLAACGSRAVDWPIDSPESRGFDSARLNAFVDGLAPLDTDAVLLARGGDLVFEWYSKRHGPETLHGIASMPKGAVGALMLIAAAERGWIGLDDEVSGKVTEWEQDPLRSRVTLRHLAAHRSGLDNVHVPEGAVLADGEEWRRVYHDQRDQRVRLAIRETPLLFPPGERYRYSGTAYYVLGYAIARSLAENGETDMQHFYASSVTRPLGIPDAAWSLSYGEFYEIDGTRVYAIGSGARFTARAVARIGQMILERGAWQGQTVFESESIAELLRRPPREILNDSGFPESGLGWYLNEDGFIPSLPRDAIICAGAGHRVLLVVPSLDLVFVRLGKSLVEGNTSNAEEQYWPEIEDYIFGPLMGLLVPAVEPAGGAASVAD